MNEAGCAEKSGGTGCTARGRVAAHRRLSSIGEDIQALGTRKDAARGLVQVGSVVEYGVCVLCWSCVFKAEILQKADMEDCGAFVHPGCDRRWLPELIVSMSQNL